jgi:sugar phosphate isomerase/epimerase
MITLCAFSDEAANSISGQADALLRNGIKFTELRSIDGVNVSKISLDEAKKYKEYLDGRGISVWSVGSPLGKISIEADFNSYLENDCRHIFELAKIFDTDKVRIFSFFDAYGKEELVLERLKKMVALASEYGLTLYHENEKDIFGDTVERVLKIREGVAGLKLIFDPANFIQVGENIERARETVLPLCDYVHVKDALYKSGEIVPAAYGDAGFEKIVSAISKREITMTLEPHLAIFAGYSQIDATELKNKFSFSSNGEAFDAAVSALKKVIRENT